MIIFCICVYNILYTYISYESKYIQKDIVYIWCPFQWDALSNGQILSVSHHAVHRWEVVEGLNVADLRSVAETWRFRDDAFYPSTISIIVYILYNLYNLYSLYNI